MGRNLTETEHAKVCNLYLKYFAEEIQRAHQFHLMPGVEHLLSTLQDRNDLLIGIATGNLEPAGWLKLKRGNIHHFFTFGGFGSDSRNRTEIVWKAIERGQKLAGCKINSDDIYVIGDTHHDVQAATELNVQSIAVTTGGYSREHFRNGHRPSHILEDFSNADDFIRLMN